MKIRDLQNRFKRIFRGKEPRFEVRVPGRINLIGAHTDYNQGLVMPVTIDRHITVLAGPRVDRRVRIFSLNYNEAAQFSLDEIKHSKHSFWSNYPKGVAKILQENGVSLGGMDALVWGDIPPGGGMSSSAALEVAFARAFLAISDFNIVPRDLALLCQQAENEFVGMNCGIMDQFSCVFGRRDNLLSLDCRSLEYELIPLPQKDVRIVVCNTMVRRELADSLYNRRRRECEEGLRRLRRYLPGILSLRDVSPADLEKYQRHLPGVIRKRCRHVLDEIRRSRLALKRLKKGDLKGFGRLIFASHESSRDLYECSSPELDLLVDTARKIEGVLGARLTGAGFGGCTVNLVEEQAIPEFKRKVIRAYSDRFGIIPEIYVCKIPPGASVRPLRQRRQRGWQRGQIFPLDRGKI